ncbi:hypothetical protein ICN35_06695 [Polynucleobacter sp. es-GGE-1]|uniref:hypothetical protein n=1 Tax=Polynucleobacter sp. es-GGE-1 TaxID=1819724 RepID=UPI001C0B5F6C|nr:hypothetical protein [Polynucleobacter sp. es-GGE-1]MBU3635143.1 hypothetical protein [Polynucleobacter sp. es-GGE-1]
MILLQKISFDAFVLQSKAKHTLIHAMPIVACLVIQEGWDTKSNDLARRSFEKQKQLI